MRIFTFEFVTAGGWQEFDPTGPPSGSLLNEGAAMLRTVTRDFLQIPGVEVCTIQDCRVRSDLPCDCHVDFVTQLEELKPTFAALAASSDYVLIIAPELGGRLDYWASYAGTSGKQLLSPDPTFISMAGDKWRTYQYLRERRIPTPETWLLRQGDVPPPHLRGSVVVKPVDGCGSIGVQRLPSPRDKIDWSELSDRAIMQKDCAGMDASVAKLCGPNGEVVLPAFQQSFAPGQAFQYIGGKGPLPKSLCDRAARLVSQPLGTTGYVGFDVILGNAEDGSEDYVIEINPRLTTSYIGLSAMCTTNLAQAMFDVAVAKEPRLEWREKCRVAFSTTGALQFMPSR